MNDEKVRERAVEEAANERGVDIERYFDADGIYRIPEDRMADWLMDWAEKQDKALRAVAREARREALEEAIGACYGMSERRGFANAGRFCDAIRALAEPAGEGES